MTRAGHVYVISNLGSFGEDTYKIGMTRRLDPQDRAVVVQTAVVGDPGANRPVGRPDNDQEDCATEAAVIANSSPSETSPSW